MTRVARLGLVIAILAAASCGGGSPSSPSASLNLVGTWTGRFEYQIAGATVSDDVTMTLLQPSATASGSWSATGQTTGTVSFPAAAVVAGTFTITQNNIGGAACIGSSTIAGTATTSDLVITVANVAPTAACPWATGMRFTLHK